MILRQETIKKFGYDPEKVKPFSCRAQGPRVIVGCETCDSTRTLFLLSYAQMKQKGLGKICSSCSSKKNVKAAQKIGRGRSTTLTEKSLKRTTKTRNLAP